MLLDKVSVEVQSLLYFECFPILEGPLEIFH
jgi:hypothetical protein